MKKKYKKIILAGILLLLTGISISIISAFQRGMSERPSLEETRSIRSSIEGFAQAKDLEERMRYVTRSPQVQKKMRSYLVVPFTQRKILDQEIRVSQLSFDPKNDRKTAVAEQKLRYLSEADNKVHEIQTTFELEKHKRWLINNFRATTVKK